MAKEVIYFRVDSFWFMRIAYLSMSRCAVCGARPRTGDVWVVEAEDELKGREGHRGCLWPKASFHCGQCGNLFNVCGCPHGRIVIGRNEQ